MNRIRIFAALAGMLAVAFGTACEHAIPTSPCMPVKYPERNGDRVSISQGIWGDVWFWEGDFMPLCPTGTITAVRREVRIHELTSLQQVASDGTAPFYREIKTPLVSTTWSDTDGFFQVSLPARRYSLFVVEGALLYANQFDGAGHIFPVEVVVDSVTEVRFDITYRASY